MKKNYLIIMNGIPWQRVSTKQQAAEIVQILSYYFKNSEFKIVEGKYKYTKEN